MQKYHSMKQNHFWLALLAAMFTLSSCEVVGGIFKAGFYTAIILIIIVVALIFWFLRRRR